MQYHVDVGQKGSTLYVQRIKILVCCGNIITVEERLVRPELLK